MKKYYYFNVVKVNGFYIPAPFERLCEGLYYSFIVRGVPALISPVFKLYFHYSPLPSLLKCILCDNATHQPAFVGGNKSIFLFLSRPELSLGLLKPQRLAPIQ